MITEVERVHREYERYADFCSRFQNNLADGSTIIAELRSLNQKLVMKEHTVGYRKIVLTKFKNQVRNRLSIIHQPKTKLVPFIELSEEQKTHEYRALERRLNTNQRSYHLLQTEYEAFVNNSMLSPFIAGPEMIVAPTVENNGDFKYPLLSNRLKYMMQCLEGGSAQIFEEAVIMLQQRTQKLENPHILNKTAESANYGGNNQVRVFFS
jgi:hypothetical protein